MLRLALSRVKMMPNCGRAASNECASAAASAAPAASPSNSNTEERMSPGQAFARSMPRNFEEYREQGMRIVDDYRRRQEPDQNLLGPKLFLSLIFGRVIEAFVERVLIGPMQPYGSFGIDNAKRAKFYEELHDSESATHKRAAKLLHQHSSGAEVAHVAHWCGIATVCFSMPDRDFHVNVTGGRFMEAVEMFQHLDAEFPATSSKVFHDVYRREQ